MTVTGITAPRGLKGVLVADTELGDVRGLEGFYHYRQYSAPELAATRTFEDVWYLLFEGHLPTRAEHDAFVAEIAELRSLPDALTPVLTAVGRGARAPLAGLRTVLSELAAIDGMPATYDAEPAVIRAGAMRMSAAVPVVIAALHRLSLGLEPLAPRGDLAYAANFRVRPAAYP